MRKFLIISAAFLAVAAGVAFVSGFIGNTIQHHKERYAASLHERMWTERMRDGWSAITGQPVDAQARSERVARELQFHERALIKLKYFEERRFLVVAKEPELVMEYAVGLWTERRCKVRLHAAMPHTAFVLAFGGTAPIGRIRSGRISPDEAGLFVIARPEDMPTWAELIQRADRSIRRVNAWNDVINGVGLLDRARQ